MTYASISELVKKLSTRAIKSSPLIALLLVAMFASAKPAQAQNGDTWKSIAIIGGSTAAGAYIGHKVAGSTGAYVGAAAGAAAGYAIDRHRRQNEYNNGYYGDNGGYYGNNSPYSNGGYYGNGPNGYPYASNYEGNNYSANDRHQSRRR
jgi:hypothetical protein